MISKEKGQDIQYWGEEQEGLNLKAETVSPRDKLQFARWILRGIFLFSMISIGIWIYQRACGETLLEICQTGLLPIVSFVIGNYFGSSSR
jgi:hypothetical protein